MQAFTISLLEEQIEQYAKSEEETVTATSQSGAKSKSISTRRKRSGKNRS